MMTDENSEELPSSDLGTLDFWRKRYAEELDNFKDHGDVGEVWFGRRNSRKIVEWMDKELILDKKNDKIIDIGCGNGMMLVELYKKGFVNLLGVDYSEEAIDLAREILKESKIIDGNNPSSVDLKVVDILNVSTNELPKDIKVAHDKGTYDAISLHPEQPTEKRLKYIKNVHNILPPDGYLIFSSCNWTMEELQAHFKNHFEMVCQLPADSFQFGGRTGNSVTQLVFRKK